MAEEKILKDEILKDAELENVAGGTGAELREVVEAMRANKKIGFDEGEYLFGSSERWDALASAKLDKLGISAKMHLGLFGSNFGESQAVYTDKATGKNLTQAEVVNIIKNYKG